MAKDTNKSFLLFHTYSKTTESPPKKKSQKPDKLIGTTYLHKVVLDVSFRCDATNTIFSKFYFFCLLQLPFLTFTDFKCPSVRAFFSLELYMHK